MMTDATVERGQRANVLQVLIPRESPTVAEFVNHLLPRLKVMSKYGLTVSTLTDPKRVSRDTPLVVICHNYSRIGADISSATYGLQAVDPKKVAVVILHVKQKFALSLTMPADNICGEEYLQYGALVDYAFTPEDKVYRCDMNTTGDKKMQTFLQTNATMSAPVKPSDSFEAPSESDRASNRRDLYPDLSSPQYIDPVEPGQEVQPVEATEEQKQEWHAELEKVEGEIATLRGVLGSKVRYASELKRKLGITPMQEMKNDFQLGIRAIKDSPTYQKTNEKLHDINEKLHQTQAYQKTSAAAKTAAEKTSSVATAVGSTITRKLGDLRNSQTFKSVEGKMESAYASVKAKVSGSKSENNFEEALQQEKEANSNGAASGTQEPLPEEKVPL